MLGVLGRWSAGVLPLAVASRLLLDHGVEGGQVAVYALYVVVGVLGPGLLVSRALLGRRPLLLADLGLGGTTGLLLTLLAWLAASALGLTEHLRWWPLLVYLPFALVPRLRRHLRPVRYAEHLGVPSAWGLAGATAVGVLGFRSAFEATPRPTGFLQWPVDMPWHLALAELFTHQARPEDPQAAGAHLAYHWFSAADVAAAHLATGAETWLVLTRLWVLPLVGLTVAMLLALARELTPRAGPVAAVAAAVVCVPAALEAMAWLRVPWDPVFAGLSPSQTYSFPFLLLAAVLVVRSLRRGGWPTLVPVAVVALLAPGAKSSLLPVLVAGLLLATAATVGRGRSWRRPGALLLVVAAAGTTGTLVLGAGGAAGARVQLGATLRRLAPYRDSVGLDAVAAAAPGGLLPSGLEVPGAGAVLLLLLAATALQFAWVLPGLVLLRRRPVGGRDPVPWFLAGVGLAGWLLMLLVDQSGASQVYFAGPATLAWAVLSGWGCVSLAERVRARRGGWPTVALVGGAALVGAAAGLACSAYATSVAERALTVPSAVPPTVTALPPPVGGPSADGARAAATIEALQAGVVPLAVLVGLGLVWVLLPRLWVRAHRGSRLLVVASAVLAASLALTPGAAPTRPEPVAPSRWAVSPAELEAARWLHENAGPHDVIATNVHCLTPRRDGQCDARAFWVSAFTGRRTLVGGWAYLDETRAMAASATVPAVRQPFHDPGLLAVNDALFVAPTPALADLLAARGVRWVYADLRRAPASAALAVVATPVFENAEVRVYRLR